jgi:hypothetical protein
LASARQIVRSSLVWSSGRFHPRVLLAPGRMTRTIGRTVSSGLGTWRTGQTILFI